MIWPFSRAARPSLLHEPAPACVLVVAAHPDDIEYMAGGTLARWIDGGTAVHYLLATDGGGGSRERHWTSETLGATRREEQRHAAERLGAASVHFLGLPDGTLEASLPLRMAIARVIRQVRPDTVLTFDPHAHYHNGGINHADHVAIGAATLGAVMPLANTLLAAPALAEEGLLPHDVAQVLLFEAATPTHWMPLSDADLICKHSALNAHTTQFVHWDGIACSSARTARLAAQARRYGIRCAHAEAFCRIVLAAPQPVARPAPVPARRSWSLPLIPQREQV